MQRRARADAAGQRAAGLPACRAGHGAARRRRGPAGWLGAHQLPSCAHRRGHRREPPPPAGRRAGRGVRARGAGLLGGWGPTSFPLALTVEDTGGRIRCMLQAAAPVDATRVLASFLRALEATVDALARAPSSSALDLDVLPPEEARRILAWGDGTVRAAPVAEPLLHRAFERQAARALRGAWCGHGDLWCAGRAGRSAGAPPARPGRRRGGAGRAVRAGGGRGVGGGGGGGGVGGVGGGWPREVFAGGVPMVDVDDEAAWGADGVRGPDGTDDAGGARLAYGMFTSRPTGPPQGGGVWGAGREGTMRAEPGSPT